jgi:hypothetical protein
MAEQADLGIPIKAQSAPGTTVLPRVTNSPPHPGAEQVHAPGSPQQPTEESTGSRGNEVDRRTLIVGEGIVLSG